MGSVIPLRPVISDLAGQMLRSIGEAGSISTIGLNDTINPRPGSGWKVDRRTRAGKAWMNRTLEIFQTVGDLFDAELVCVTRDSDGENPWEMGVTEAGRRYLAVRS